MSEYSSKYYDLPICEKFQENQVINLMEQVTLKNAQGMFKNYIAVATITTNTSMLRPKSGKPDEEGFYSSSLNMY